MYLNALYYKPECDVIGASRFLYLGGIRSGSQTGALAPRGGPVFVALNLAVICHVTTLLKFIVQHLERN